MNSIANDPDLDAITRNLTAFDLAHLTPEETADYEQELSAITLLPAHKKTPPLPFR